MSLHSNSLLHQSSAAYSWRPGQRLRIVATLSQNPARLSSSGHGSSSVNTSGSRSNGPAFSHNEQPTVKASQPNHDGGVGAGGRGGSTGWGWGNSGEGGSSSSSSSSGSHAALAAALLLIAAFGTCDMLSSTATLSLASVSAAAVQQQRKRQQQAEALAADVGEQQAQNSPNQPPAEQQDAVQNSRDASSSSSSSITNAWSQVSVGAASDDDQQQQQQQGQQQQPAAPSPPKRIVLFIEPSPFTYMSGYQTRFLATIKEMVAAGCVVLVVTPGRGAAGLLPGGQQQPTEFAGARVVEAGSFPCPGYGTVPLSLGLSPRIFNEVRRWKPELIHVTSPGALPIAAWLYSRILRVPLVSSYHTHVPSYLPKMGLSWLEHGMWGLIRTIHRASHLTIAVSPKTASDLVAAGACDNKAVKVWPKAVDCELFNPRHACPQMRQRLLGAAAAAGDATSSSNSSSSSAAPLLLYVGRVSPEKNLKLLRSVLEKVPGARLAVVGDGPAFQDMVEHFKGTPTVFLGSLKGKELAAAYASADIFCMPSETETLGNVVGEAMAAGLPVVAAAAGGIPSFITRPGTGVLFPPGDAKAAAAAIKRLMADPKARRNMSLAARAEMEQWSWRRATLEILNKHYPAAMAANQAELLKQDAWGAAFLGAAASTVAL